MIVKAITGHAVVGEAVSATLAREGPREGVDTAHRKPDERRDKSVRGRPHRSRGEEHALRGQGEPRTGQMRFAEARDRVT